MSKNKLASPVCALDYAFKRIGGKHKGCILWYIHGEGNLLRYRAFKRLIQNIISKMFTQSLRELREDNLINRKNLGCCTSQEGNVH